MYFSLAFSTVLRKLFDISGAVFWAVAQNSYNSLQLIKPSEDPFLCLSFGKGKHEA